MPISPTMRSLAQLADPMKEAAERLEREWSPDPLPDTVAAAALARAFGSAIPLLGASDICAVAEAVEDLLVNGDESTKDAIATGFLESLLAQASQGTIDFQRIAGILGPESAKFCRAWDEFTGFKTAGLHVKPS